MKEIHRVLKDGGTLPFNDHHMKDKEIRSKVTRHGFFKFSWRGNKTYNFAKVN
jgi:ubiquinone/menaquinone biosynthesis C-methylase UbiE